MWGENVKKLNFLAAILDFWQPSWIDNGYFLTLYSTYAHDHLYQFWCFYQKVNDQHVFCSNWLHYIVRNIYRPKESSHPCKLNITFCNCVYWPFLSIHYLIIRFSKWESLVQSMLSQIFFLCIFNSTLIVYNFKKLNSIFCFQNYSSKLQINLKEK